MTGQYDEGVRSSSGPHNYILADLISNVAEVQSIIFYLLNCLSVESQKGLG